MTVYNTKFTKCPKCHTYVEGCNYCPNCGKKLFTSQKKSRKRPNGQGSVYRPADRSTFIVKIPLGQGKYKRIGGFQTKAEAEAYLSRHIGQTRFGTFANMWELSQPAINQLSANRKRGYERAYERCYSLHNKEISSLTVMDLQRVIDNEVETYDTAKAIQNVMSHCYKAAIKSGIVTSNLAMYVDLPKKVKKEPHQPFTEEEIVNLWKGWKSGDEFCGYILVMIYSGVRPGEFLNITKDKIDLDKRVFHDIGTKTEESHKDVLFASTVEPVVRKLIELSETERFYPYYKEKFRKDFKKCCLRNECRDLVPYSTRHTFGTFMLREDASHAKATKAMRHSRLETIEQYEHLDNDDARDAVEALAKIINPDEV